MQIEIDQSGKVEATSMNIVVADLLGNSILIRSKDKREIQAIYREIGKPRIYVFELFSLLVASIIKHTFAKQNQYIIDIEYFSKNDYLRSLILKYLGRFKVKAEPDQINFARIGKKSNAHTYAYKRLRGRKPLEGKTLNIDQILRIILQ